jgi:membrane protein implicated in regulation of membrane protease activity
LEGALWEATCAAGADAGDTVTVLALDGLTLVVEPQQAAPVAAGPTP